MNLALPHRIGILAALVVLLVGTGTDHFGPLPNAALGVFFLAGFYVGGTRGTLPLLIVAALGSDYVVVTSAGHDFWSHYCVSVAYWFLIPAYACMWLGGSWLRRQYRPAARTIVLAGIALIAAFTVSFAFSNGSFYWLSGRYADPHWAQFIERYTHYYPGFLSTTLAYVSFDALLHVQVLLLMRYFPRPLSRPVGD